MTRKPPATPQELWDMILRRRRWVLAPLCLVPLLVFVVSLMLPKHYVSETVVLVDPQKIPVEYVKAAVASDITERLQTIKEEVMSRTRLEQIADELGLYRTGLATGQTTSQTTGQGAAQGARNEDRVIAAMQQDMTVTLIKGSSDHNAISGFKISYTASSPQLAQKVTQRIADLFIAENLKARAREAEGTNDFISEELTKARVALEAQEARIKEFKAEHMGSLPEQESSNLTLVSQYQALAQANGESIDRANQQRVYLESMLNVSGGSTPKAGSPEPTPLQMELSAKRAELAADRQKYTDEYPDVARLKSEIAELEQQQRSGARGISTPAGGSSVAAAGSSSSSGPSVTRQLEGQLLAIQQEIRMRTERQAEIEGKMRAMQGNIAMLPATQQEFADLNRDYLSMQTNYAALEEKRQASGMATELERHNDSESFRILDPASLPTAPSSPNLLIVNAGGLFGGLVLGLALGLLLDLRDDTLHNPDELERYLDLPLIVAIPTFTAAGDSASLSSHVASPKKGAVAHA